MRALPWFLTVGAIIGGAVLSAGCGPKPASADARLQALYAAEWKWRVDQFPDEEDAQKPVQDRFPTVDAAAQDARLRYWQDVLAKLKDIPRAALSAEEQLNYDVYRPQIEGLIADQQFREYEMPVNADTTFWTNLSYTARRPFRIEQEYRNWLAQMRDVPRYFREQTDEMRAGLKRGFTPPRVTITGLDASITAVTDANPEASLFYTPFKDMAGVPAATQASLRADAVATIRDSASRTSPRRKLS